MRIGSILIRNFRSIREQFIELGDYTCLVGENGSGKSNVIHALNVLFGEPDIPGLDARTLSEEDFHKKNTREPIEIVVTFTDLSAEAKQELAHYVRQDQLVVSVEARFNAEIGKAEVKQYGRRMVVKDFAPFFEAEKEGKIVSDLKKIYSDLRAAYAELPAPGTKAAMIAALRSYEESHSGVAPLSWTV